MQKEGKRRQKSKLGTNGS